MGEVPGPDQEVCNRVERCGSAQRTGGSAGLCRERSCRWEVSLESEPE